jgi:hypothetical protein
MSGDERAASDGRQTDPDETAAVEQVLERSAEEPEEKLARLRRVALPSAQRIAGKRRRQSDALVRVLTSISMYSIPAIALLAAVGAIGYSAWAAWGVAQSAGSLDFSQVDAGFSQIDAAARALVASSAYFLLIIALYLVAAALRTGENWLTLLVILVCAAPVAVLFTLGADLAFSLAPTPSIPQWARDTVEAAVLGHAVVLAVLLRGRRPISQIFNHLAYTRRGDAGTLYDGELPRLHVIRFATGEPPAASASPPAAPTGAAADPERGGAQDETGPDEAGDREPATV